MCSAAEPSPAPSVEQTLLEYQAILENASIGILFTRDRQVLHCNPRCSAIYGWPHGELVGQPGSVFYVSPQDYDALGLQAGPVLSRGDQFNTELSMRRKDGGVVHCHLRAKAINPRNTTEGTIWIIEDISERKTQQARMQELLHQQRAILENASIGILFTRNGRVVQSNPRMEAIYGWAHGSLTGQRGAVFFKDEQDYQRFGELHGPSLARGELIDVEWLNVRRDGTPFWCRHLAKALPSRDGSQSTIWISEDISEKKDIEQALQLALYRQQAILENASVAIVFAKDGVIVQCNPHAEAIYGWPTGGLAGQNVACLFKDRDDFHRFSREISTELMAGRKVDIEWINARRDGTSFWCRSLARRLPSENGTVSSIWINEDITEKKSAQQALNQAYQALKTRVQERTADLQTAHQQIEAVIRSSPLAIYTRDLDSRITSWNPAAEKIFGWKASEVVGAPIPTRPRTDWAAIQALSEPGQTPETQIQSEVVRRRRDGRRIHISRTIAPLIDANGQCYGSVTIAADITERKAAEQRIEFLAYHDTLTGLPNRLMLRERMQQAMLQADRSGKRIALVFMDLDNFKQINDTLGHSSGDRLLQEVSIRLRDYMRGMDMISRQGGDEFVMALLDLPDRQAALHVVDKIMRRMQQPFYLEGKELLTSISVGVALYPDDGHDFETLLKMADMAMYRAKEDGRNVCHFFDAQMSRQAQENMLLRTGLQRAIERDELLLYYQPQLSLSTGRIIGVEALLRWNHPDLGLLEPARFVPVAESSGLIGSIGEWVLRQACQEALDWKNADGQALSVAVNLSAVQFRRGNLETVLPRILAQTGLAPERLELELTESVLLDNVEQVLVSVQRLKQLGVRLAIDDFGTGYSSLSYLKRLDIDKLKIDRSFVRELTRDGDDAAIVRAIIQMAHSLNLRTTAEGVEFPDTVELLREFGCDDIQGYLCAYPMPAYELSRFLGQVHRLPATPGV